jgi:hypothetical protein
VTETVVFWFVEYVLHLLCLTQNYKMMMIMMMTEEAASGTRKVFSTSESVRERSRFFVTEIVLFGVWCLGSILLDQGHAISLDGLSN